MFNEGDVSLNDRNFTFMIVPSSLVNRPACRKAASDLCCNNQSAQKVQGVYIMFGKHAMTANTAHVSCSRTCNFQQQPRLSAFCCFDGL